VAEGSNTRRGFQMMRKAALFFVAAGLALAGSHTYTVNLLVKSTVGGTDLAPGEYKVEVNDQTATIRQGKIQSESPVKVEENNVKFATTTVRYGTSDGKSRIQEIHIGGTKTKLVFAQDSAGVAASQ
jgi:hypothetical protein